MKVTNEAPSSTHEWRADRGGEASICLLSFGALYSCSLEPFPLDVTGSECCGDPVAGLSSGCDDYYLEQRHCGTAAPVTFPKRFSKVIVVDYMRASTGRTARLAWGNQIV